jgi:hypothetical protein
MVTATQPSTENTTLDLHIKLASYNNNKKYTKAETKEEIYSSVWDELYQKDKQFTLYTQNYRGWRYNLYGDDVSSITTSINLCWLHAETNIPSPRKRTCLANFWAQEGYP